MSELRARHTIASQAQQHQQHQQRGGLGAGLAPPAEGVTDRRDAAAKAAAAATPAAAAAGKASAVSGTHGRECVLGAHESGEQAWPLLAPLSRALSMAAAVALAALFAVFRWQLPFLAICSSVVFGVLLLGWLSGACMRARAQCDSLMASAAAERPTQELMRHLRGAMVAQGEW